MLSFAVGLGLMTFISSDSMNKTIAKDFSFALSAHSDDATTYFRGFDLSTRYEFKRKGKLGSHQLELLDDFGISMFHGGLWVIRNDRFIVRLNFQRSSQKVTLSGSCALEGPLFSKRDLIFSQNGNAQRLPSKGGFLDPCQLIFSGGLRWNIRKGVMVDVGAPALAVKRTSLNGFYNRLLEREWSSRGRRHVRYSLGVQTVWTVRLVMGKALTFDSRSFLFLNGYRFKYQQWSQELKWTWLLHKQMELCFLLKFNEDRTIAPKVFNSYSLRVGIKLGQRFN